MSEPRDPAVPEPLQRRTYTAAELIRQHPPVLRNENKQVLFAIACPAGAVHSGRLEYSRWPEIPLPPPREVDPVSAARLVVVRDGFYDYRPILDPGVGVEWHVNFADPNLFYAYGSALFAQDEIQVAEHPVLGSLREALVAEGRPTTTIENGRPTPVLVMGAERRVRIRDRTGVRGRRPELAVRHGVREGHGRRRSRGDDTDRSADDLQHHRDRRPVRRSRPIPAGADRPRDRHGLLWFPGRRSRVEANGRPAMPWSPSTPVSGDAGRSAATGS